MPKRSEARPAAQLSQAMQYSAGLGGRSTNVCQKVSFLVEKTDKGGRVMVRSQWKPEEVIPLTALEEPINRRPEEALGVFVGRIMICSC